MQINFRQGIISSQKLPSFLRMNPQGNIDFDATSLTTSLSFADGSSNYLFDELLTIQDAWSNLPRSGEYWIYWDIDVVTAQRSFGYTIRNPFSTVPPSSPVLNQMYFDLNDFKYKSWNGEIWIHVIRVIAGHVVDGVVNPQAIGSQVNYSLPCNTDYIVFDITNLPIKNYMGNGIEFLTKSMVINFKNNGIDSLNYDRVLDSHGTSTEPLVKHSCVTWDNYNTLGLADPSKQYSPAFGLAERSVDTGEIVSIVSEGFIMNRTDWNWPYPEHTELFVGTDGTLVTTFDVDKSIQKVGYIVSPNLIYINFGYQYRPIEQPTSETCPPSPTPSPTPSPLPAVALYGTAEVEYGYGYNGDVYLSLYYTPLCAETTPSKDILISVDVSWKHYQLITQCTNFQSYQDEFCQTFYTVDPDATIMNSGSFSVDQIFSHYQINTWMLNFPYGSVPIEYIDSTSNVEATLFDFNIHTIQGDLHLQAYVGTVCA